MNRPFRFVIILLSILLIAHRSPAPIVEEEKPTPAPEKSAKPKPKRTSEPTTHHANSPSPTPRISKKFAGKWSGVMPEVPWGNIATELVVDPTETTIEWYNGLDSKRTTAKATLNGNTLSALFPGWPRPVWSITPDPGGNTAQVRLQAFMNDDHAVFQRVSR